MEETKTEAPSLDMPIKEDKRTEFVRNQQSLQIQARREKNLTDGRRGESFKHDLSRDARLAKARAEKPRRLRMSTPSEATTLTSEKESK